MTTLPAPDPEPQADALPFWDAAAEGILRVPHCGPCDRIIWYPRGFCAECGSVDVDWIDLPGTGTVYATVVARKGQGAYRDHAPYCVAYVELDVPGDAPGPRVVTNVVDVDPTTVAIGDRVTARFDATASGHALLRFRPVPPTPPE